MKKNRRIGKIDAVWLGKLHSLMKHGYTVAEAAEHMNVSDGVVNKYYRILRKIDNREPVEEKSNYCKSAVREYCQKQNLKLFEEMVGEDLEPDGDKHNSDEQRRELDQKMMEIRFADGSIGNYRLGDVVFVEEKDFCRFSALLNEEGYDKVFVCVNQIQAVVIEEE